MKQLDHRTADAAASDVQRGSREWWSANPMTYDWKGGIELEPSTRPWFDEVDRRFIDAGIPYVTDKRPFDRIMPDDLSGKRVLEIGCGMGLHTSESVRRGAELTAIDLTDFAVKATTTRLELHGLEAVVQQADAESLDFDDDSFDLVWSWGVIHHSSSTTRIVREIARVLKPRGEARIMVYNRESFMARYQLFRHYLVGRDFRHSTPDEVLWKWTDGYMARYYPPEQFNDLFQGFFATTHTEVVGQEVDAIPLPGQLRRRVSRYLSNDRKLQMASKRGMFLFTVATDPV